MDSSLIRYILTTVCTLSILHPPPPHLCFPRYILCLFLSQKQEVLNRQQPKSTNQDAGRQSESSDIGGCQYF